MAGKGTAGSPGMSHRAAPVSCSALRQRCWDQAGRVPILPACRAASGSPPAPGPGSARSAWERCEEPKDRGHPSPAPTGAGRRCSPLQGREKPEPAPALDFKGSRASAMVYTSRSSLLSKHV